MDDLLRWNRIDLVEVSKMISADLKPGLGSKNAVSFNSAYKETALDGVWVEGNALVFDGLLIVKVYYNVNKMILQLVIDNLVVAAAESRSFYVKVTEGQGQSVINMIEDMLFKTFEERKGR